MRRVELWQEKVLARMINKICMRILISHSQNLRLFMKKLIKNFKLSRVNIQWSVFLPHTIFPGIKQRCQTSCIYSLLKLLSIIVISFQLQDGIIVYQTISRTTIPNILDFLCLSLTIVWWLTVELKCMTKTLNESRETCYFLEKWRISILKKKIKQYWCLISIKRDVTWQQFRIVLNA